MQINSINFAANLTATWICRAVKYYVDAKSIMGIFSLDLSKPLVLNAGTDDEQKIKETFADFIREE